MPVSLRTYFTLPRYDALRYSITARNTEYGTWYGKRKADCVKHALIKVKYEQYFRVASSDESGVHMGSILPGRSGRCVGFELKTA